MPLADPVSSSGELHRLLSGGEEWFRAMFEGSAIAIVVTDMDGCFIEVNAAFQRLVGFGITELRGKSFTELNHPDDNDRNLMLFGKLGTGELSHYQIEKRYVARDGSTLPVRLTTSVVRDADGQPRFCVGMVEDITERKRAEAERQALENRLRHNALHDPLTELPNRVLFGERLERILARATRESRTCAVLFLDLDRFKVVNDSLGHLVGDELLRTVASRLQLCVRPADTVARFGGDEFVILLEHLRDAAQAVTIARRIQRSLSAPVDLGGYETFTTVSIGIALSGSGETPEHLIRNADMALYRAKVSGLGHCVVFDRSMHAAAMQRLQLETDLRHALHRGEFQLFYQPLVALDTGRITAMEALARWHHPLEGMIPPDTFIPVAEETGLILPFSSWVMGEAMRQLAEWKKEAGAESLEISINLSARQLIDPTLPDEIARLLSESGLAPRSVKLELTESTMMENPAAAATLLRQLRELDVQICLDDFGTGYSSLSYLHQLPLDALKIDRSFVRGLEAPDPEGRNNAEIIRTVVTLARSLGVRVVAEGVETREQLAILRNLGCDFGQGFLFSPAVPADTARALIAGAARL